MIVAEHRRLLQLLATESDMLVAPGQQLDAALAGVRFPRAQYSAVFDSDHPGNPDSVHSSACSDYTPEPGRPDLDLDDPAPAPSADPEHDLLIQHVELGLRLPGLSSCPDEELELSIVAEFQSLRQQFVHRREKLRLAHAETAQGPYCGWSPADHLWFLKVEKEYTKTKLGAKLKMAGTTVRKMMFDRMLLEKPGLLREHITAHEKLVASRRFYFTQLRYLEELEHEEVVNLMDYANVALRNAAELQQQQLEHDDEQDAFDKLRLEMNKKLLQWKKKRLEVIEKENRQKEAQLVQQTEWDRQEQERMKLERLALKRSIDGYHQEKQRKVQATKEVEARMFELARFKAAEVAKVNEGRVEHRQHMQEEKETRAEAKRLVRAELERQRDVRLDALRATVKVEATIDPERARGHTVASNAAADEAGAERIMRERQTGRSFVNYGYSENQVGQDQRVRIEMMLRANGLQGSTYARQMMRTVAPPSQPRRDMKHTSWKQE